VAERRVTDILDARRGMLEKLAAALNERSYLSGKDIEEMMLEAAVVDTPAEREAAE